MADTLLQNLDELVNPALTDLLYMVADPAGTPADRKVQFSTVLDRAKGYSIILDASGKGDYTDLATALAALSAGDVLFIRNGTYAGGVTIATDEITLIGETRNGVIIQSLPNNAAPAIKVNAEKVTLHNFTIDGQRDTQGTGDWSITDRNGIYILADECVVDTVRIFDTHGMGISAQSNGGRIVNCHVENIATDGAAPTIGPKMAYGIFLRGSARWNITYNYVTGWSQGCGLWWGCSDNVVAFNRFVANYGYHSGQAGGHRSAFEDYGSTDINYRNIVFGNLIDGSTSLCIECASGTISSQYISNICLNANKFQDSATGHVVVISSDTVEEPTYDIVLANNSITGSFSPLTRGLYVSARGSVQITGNTFQNCADGNDGAITLANNTRAIFRNNIIKNCYGGIALRCTPPALIDGNVFIEPANTNNVIRTFNSYSTISNNTFDTNGVNLIAIAVYNEGGAAYHRITQNTFIGFIQRCIDLRGDYCYVAYNHISSTADEAVYMASGALLNVVEQNTFNCNKGRAITIDTGATYNIVQNNMLIGAIAGIYNSGGVTNQTTPNHTGTFSRIVGVLKSLGAQTVGASQATIAHGLAYTPTEVQVTMTSAGTIWKSAASDGTNIYLTADDADRTAEIFVR